MKLLVETTGDFMFQLSPGVEIPANRPAVVAPTYFVASKLGNGELAQIAQLSDEATDEEFKKYYDESADKDPEKNDPEKQKKVAVESFKSKFEESPKKDQHVAFVDDTNVNEQDEFEKKNNKARRDSTVTTGKPGNEPEKVNK